MQYPHIIRHNPILYLRIPMAFLNTIQRHVWAQPSRQTRNERPTLSYYEWGLANDAARARSDFWVHQLLS